MQDELHDFLLRWHDDNPLLLVHTSGSTGAPKPLWVEKERMRASARMTCNFLQLPFGATALLCMPLRYIAGMMMVVRAVERKMQLVCVPPSNRPLCHLPSSAFVMDFRSNPNGTLSPASLAEPMRSFDFVAMVPSQVYETLRHPDEAARLRQVHHLLIGGGAIPPELEMQLRSFPHPVWSSYGMTETLSHIALRRVDDQRCGENKTRAAQREELQQGEARPADGYTPLPGVTLSQSMEGCLIINAPHLCAAPLLTHDIVEMNADGSFRIVGRSDNVVCSGGIKIQIEEVESRLRPHFGDHLIVSARPHPKFGEALVYLTDLSPYDFKLRWGNVVQLPSYWLPKHVCYLNALPRTATGKIDRARAHQLAIHAD